MLRRGKTGIVDVGKLEPAILKARANSGWQEETLLE
jgi:hypothetical protein